MNTKTALLLFLMLAAVSCKKKDALPEDGSRPETINRWVFSQMQTYYYWNNELPTHTAFNKDPNDFFTAIKYKEDRFSSLYYKKNPSGIKGTLVNTFGLDLEGILEKGVFKVSITLVAPYSTAAQQGLMRGLFLKAINNNPITAENISTLVKEALLKKSLSVTLQNDNTITLPAAYISEPVVYKSAVFKTPNHNVGYLFINSFEYHGVYDLLNAFKNFKEQHISELIIDLRYNTGGSVPFSALVCALIAPVREEQLYVTYKGNKNAGTINSSFENELSKQPNGYYFNMVALESYRLNLTKVYLLTGHLTTSAPELIINNLKPYITTIQIGEKTFGKDMASLELKDNRTPPVITDVTLYPLCFKLYNANGKGDYNGGIDPNYFVKEYDVMPLLPFGDENDPLIKQALSLIEGKLETRITLHTPGKTELIFQSGRQQSLDALLLYTE